jgi:hypothetical protein
VTRGEFRFSLGGPFGDCYRDIDQATNGRLETRGRRIQALSGNRDGKTPDMTTTTPTIVDTTVDTNTRTRTHTSFFFLGFTFFF